jgi:hypothetical protein
MTSPKLGQVRIQRVAVHVIDPHPLNDKLYKPVDPMDPDVQALAASIKDFGVKEPLVLTSDLYVLSGHRRLVAARLAGLSWVPCRVEDFDHLDDRVPELLVTYNRQRVKTSAEVLREEVLLSDPEEAHRVLIEHRRRKADLQLDRIEIPDFKRRAKISPAKTPLLRAIQNLLDEFRDWWPLTDRQIHYNLLNDPPLVHASKPGSTYANTKQCYKGLCDLLTRARLAGHIPMEAIDDATRPVCIWDVHASVGPFIRGEVDDLLKGYYRDLLQSQANQIEIIGEKNTIESVVRSVSMPYCIPYTIGRGYSSLPPRWRMAKRFKMSGKEKLLLLVLCDWDPEGEDIGKSFARSMRDDFGIRDVEAVKVALTREQVRDMKLPPEMKAKSGSSRRKKFVEQHGDDVFELEAVPPNRLQEILTEAIDNVIDVDAFNAEVEREKQEAAYLDGVRQVVKTSLTGLDGFNFNEQS